MSRKSVLVATYDADIERVWGIVTNNKEYGWRSDLSSIEVKDEKHFIEVTPKGYRTNFEITKFKPCSRYEFDMKNESLSGHWTGVFESTESGGTKITFTEELDIPNPVMRRLMPLKKMQKVYAEDLRKALGESM